jgi:hypothetical protein
MSRVLSTITLPSRLLVAISIALVISSIVADLYGARLESSYRNTIPVGPGITLFLGVSSVTSSGKVSVEVEGSSNVYYMRLTGDPFTLAQQFRALNLNVSASRPQLDLRAGVAYVVFLIQASPAIVQALSLLGEVIPVVQAGGSTPVIEARLATGDNIIVIVTEASKPTVSVRVSYSVEGYSRLAPLQAAIVSAAIILVVASIELLRRRGL